MIQRSNKMVNAFAVLTPLLHGLVKVAGLTPQTIEIVPGTLMNVWVPKETVTKKDQDIVFVPPTKPAVLFLHAFALDGIFTWFPQVLALNREYAVYIPDLLFFGGSITDRNERSASFQAEFVAKGLGKLKGEKVTLVGLSYGGIVGFKMAELYPELVKSIVVSATVVELTQSISSDFYKKFGFTRWSDLLMPETIADMKRLFSFGFHKFPWLPNFVYRHFLEVSLELSF
ncbi:putative alpha/beta hydrolase-1 [Helianthus debilis subsp. tardiflorus]